MHAQKGPCLVIESPVLAMDQCRQGVEVVVDLLIEYCDEKKATLSSTIEERVNKIFDWIAVR